MGTRKKAYTLQDCESISIKWLRLNGFLKKDKITFQDIEMTSAGDFYNLKILTSITDKPVVVFSFDYEGERKRFDIELVRRPTRWGGRETDSFYMVDPRSGHRCNKLFLYQGKVVGARASGLLYSSQIRDNRIKALDAKYGKSIRAENALIQLNEPGFRKYYAGKLTKRYLRLCEIVRLGEGSPDFTMEDLKGVN